VAQGFEGCRNRVLRRGKRLAIGTYEGVVPIIVYILFLASSFIRKTKGVVENG